MLYKQFQDLKLSALGFGCMRFPTLEGDNARINEPLTHEMVRRAMEAGINYYDTAWVYHKGNSERVISEALREYPRDSYYLATKLSAFNEDVCRDCAKHFENQLKTCGTDYFDFYLLHCVQESNIDWYLKPENGVIEYLKAQKAAGRIRHIGFSCHCSLHTLERMLDECGDVMEFCQIELNWYDWLYQRAADKVALLNSRNMPIWVMEPVRGGKLAQLSDADAETLKNLRPDESIPAWSFRFLQGLDGVGMILSGMTAPEQLEDNFKTFETEKPLNEQEKNTLLSIAEKMIAAGTVPCSACRYCCEACPAGLEIPALIKLYNDHILTKDSPLPADAFNDLLTPDNCLACESCEQHCPQGIRIHEVMAAFAEKLEG